MEVPSRVVEVEAEINTYSIVADFAAVVDSATILDDMAENLSDITKNETLAIIDDLMRDATDMTYIHPVQILSDPSTYTASNSDWFFAAGHRHLLAVHYSKLAATLSRNQKALLKCCAGSPAKLKMSMNKPAPTIAVEAQKFLEAHTGGMILTLVQAANSNAADLSEVKCPL